MPDIRELEIDKIKIDAQIQPREGLDDSTVTALKELYEEDQLKAFPPVVVYHDADDVYWLADGHYRIRAISEACVPDRSRTVQAEVRDGSKREAILYAAGANAKHGTPLTRQEKRRLVIRLLQDDEWGKLSDNEIASHIGVSNGLVSGIHRELRDLDSQEASLHHAKMPPPRTTTYVRNGKKITQKTDNIGRGRSKKAKTETTTTMPDNSAEAPENPHTDVATERNVDDNQEAVRTHTAAPTISAVAQDEHRADEYDEDTTNDAEEAGDTQGYIDLVIAWYQATIKERLSFLDMLKTHKEQDCWKEVTQAANAVREQMALLNEDMR